MRHIAHDSTLRDRLIEEQKSPEPLDEDEQRELMNMKIVLLQYSAFDQIMRHLVKVRLHRLLQIPAL